MGVKKGVVKKLDAEVELSLRLDQDMTSLESLFTDWGLRYKISDLIRFGATYRIGAKYDPVGLASANQRFAYDLIFKTKWKKLSVAYRTRYQMRTSGSLASEQGIEFRNAWRNKISLSRKIIKRTELNMSGELFVGNNKRYGNEISDYRVKVGLERRIKKRQYLSVGLLHQREVHQNNPLSEWVLFWGYSYEFKGNIFKKSRARQDSDPNAVPPSK